METNVRRRRKNANVQKQPEIVESDTKLISKIGYSKAFDCVDHETLWNMMREMGIPEHLVRLTRNLYSSQEAKYEQNLENNQFYDRWLIFIIILCAVIFIPITVLILLPSPIDAKMIWRGEAAALEGTLAPNNLLTKAEHIYQGLVTGPESLVVQGDVLYTGTTDGRVVRLENGEVTTIAKFGSDPCYDEETCGRPLGMRLSKSGGLLYVLDGYLGLHEVDLVSNRWRVLWPGSAAINGRHAKLFNDLDVTDDGKIYFTDSSTKWHRRDYVLLALEGDTSSRLVEYDLLTNTTKEIATGMLFANGVQLSPDGSFLLVVECGVDRVWKYYLKGEKRGQWEVFADGLPGLPDNIRPSSTGGYWVGLASVQKHKFSMIRYLDNKPWLRNILSKLSYRLTRSIISKYGLIVELDQEGRVVRSLHDPSGLVVPSVSEVVDTGSHLYLGSYQLSFVSKVTL